MKIKKGLEKEWEKFVETNSKDSYSSGVLSFMIRWAKLMEIDIEDEIKLTKKLVDQSSDLADAEGITGAMYEVSKGYLGYFWEHGELLKSILGKKVIIRG